MFFKLAASLNPPSNTVTQNEAETILNYEAPVVSYLMEAAWSTGGPGLLGSIPTLRPAPVGVILPGFAVAGRWSAIFDHLIYAYMVENTRIYEIFRRVIWEYAHGERLGIPQLDGTYRWLRTTEELFYKDASPFQPYNLVSRIRPDIAASRRNAYYRMFGMDLNHGRDGANVYPYEKPAAANREFVATFEDFLREVWRAIENSNNFLAGNPTDRQSILDLSLRLQNMLNARRGGNATRPNLSRDESLAVNLMSWMSLTVAFDTSIVRDLVATGPSPEERLRIIGERVGLPPHGRSHSYFIIAPLISALLIEIELGHFNDIPEIETLFAPGPNPVRDNVSSIIHHWSIISGRDLKSARTTVSPSLAASRSMAPMPAAAAATSTVAVASGNGKVPAGSA